MKENNLWRLILSLGSTVISKTKYGTAMDPILILIAIVVLPGLITFGLTGYPFLLVIVCAPILLFVFAYYHFMTKNPNMLRSEKHEETMFRIASAMGQKDKELPEEVVDALPAVTAIPSITSDKPELISVKKEKGKHV